MFEVPLIETAIIVLERVSKEIIEEDEIKRKLQYSVPIFRIELNDLSLLSELSQSEDVVSWNTPIESFIESIDHRFEIRVSDESENVLKKLAIDTIPLGEMGELRGGIMGFNYWEMEKNVTDDQPDEGEYLKVITPTHIIPYRVQWKKRAKLYGKVYLHPYLKYNPKDIIKSTWGFFQKRKIVIRGVARRLTAAYDDEGCALLVAVFAIVSPKYNHNYIIGLLNSKLLDFFHKSKYRARIPRGSLRYPKAFLQNIPIKIPSKSEDEDKAKDIAQKTEKITNLLRKQRKYKRVKNNFDLLLKDIRTTKLSTFPNIMFNFGKGNLDQIRRVEDVVFLSLVDSIQCNDVLVAKYVECYLKANQDKISQMKDIRGQILNLQIPLEKNDIDGVVRKYETIERKVEEIPTRIGLLKNEIDSIVYTLYRITKSESELIEKSLLSFG